MEPEQYKNFNERLSQWISSQGFWFQIRYSMSASGMKGSLMFHFFKLSFRILIFLLVVAAGTWVFLVKRTDLPRTIAIQRQRIQEALFASNLEMTGYHCAQGQLEISRLVAEGENNTFFSALEAQNIRCHMSPVDGLVRKWKPGVIFISKLDLDLRAGADDAESARKLASALFYKSSIVEVSSFEVGSATLRWGFSERTQGSIISSNMIVFRYGDGWKITLKGGTFSQNWLQNLKIIHLEVICDKDGLVFQKAEFKQGEGTVDFSGLRLVGGDRPSVSGTAKIRNLNLGSAIPPALQSFVEGSFSGDFKVTGSTNSSKGIGFEGQVVLGGKDIISLRQRIPLLRALSVVDYSRKYYRVDFNEGVLRIKTTNGGMDLTNVKLKAEDLLTLEGSLKVRLPTTEEIQTALEKGAGTENSSLFTIEDAEAVKQSMLKLVDFSLNKAGQEAKRIKEGVQSIESLSLFDRVRANADLRLMKEMESERMSRMLRYEGSFLITIPGNAFERAPVLQQLYPMNAGSGRIPIQVPIEGDIYEVTYKQAEETYTHGQR